MYGPARTVSGVADADALCSSLRNLPVEAAFAQVGRSLQPWRILHWNVVRRSLSWRGALPFSVLAPPSGAIGGLGLADCADSPGHILG